jgi:CRISPR-associated protein Cas1
VRYHQQDTTVRFPLDEPLRQQVREAVTRARQLRALTERPLVTKEERKCARCSLAPVCLPEEERAHPEGEPLPGSSPRMMCGRCFTSPCPGLAWDARPSSWW